MLVKRNESIKKRFLQENMAMNTGVYYVLCDCIVYPYYTLIVNGPTILSQLIGQKLCHNAVNRKIDSVKIYNYCD